jgi:cytochrome c-type biogenesis protein CcmH/NrfG
MIEEAQSVKAGWTSVQVYAMALVCLLVGVSVGYLFRGSTSSMMPQTQVAAAQARATEQGQQGSVSTQVPASTMPSPEQLKQMADQKVAPLLDQLQQHPKDVETLTQVGAFYFAAHQFQESENYYQRAVDVKPTPAMLTKLANAQFYGGGQAKAMASLDRALQLDSTYADALFNLGMMKFKVQDDSKGAITCWEKLLKAHPDHPGRAQVEQMIVRAKERERGPNSANVGFAK